MSQKLFSTLSLRLYLLFVGLTELFGKSFKVFGGEIMLTCFDFLSDDSTSLELTFLSLPDFPGDFFLLDIFAATGVTFSGEAPGLRAGDGIFFNGGYAVLDILC